MTTDELANDTQLASLCIAVGNSVAPQRLDRYYVADRVELRHFQYG